MPATAEPDAPDLWFGGRLRLRQPPRGAHRAGTDALLLARLVAPEPGTVIGDLGAGTGAVGLAVAISSPTCRVLLVERDPGFAGLARENVVLNGLADRVEVIEADLLAPAAVRHAAGLEPGLADVVLTNPPFHDGRHRPSPVPGKAAAHSFRSGDLDTWLRTCLDLLKPGGRLGLIHRADALPACLEGLRGRFGAIEARPVHARAGRAAIRVLITAVKGSRAPFVLRPPLVLADVDGCPTAEAEVMAG